MKLVAVGQSPTGIIAIGQVPTGVVAIGQVATGVIAVGQVARGVIVVGQLTIGVVALGQVAVGLVWAAGMLGLAPITPGWLLAPPWFGHWPLRAVLRARWRSIEWRKPTGTRRIVAGAVLVACTFVVAFVALGPLYDALTKVGGILREKPGLR